MGLAPVTAAVGDRIAIFVYGNSPFVIWSASGGDGEDARYILLGSCYLDGDFSCF